MATRTRTTEPAERRMDADYGRQPRGGPGWGIWAIVALIVAGLLVWAIWATVGDDSAAIDEGATVSEILENPDEFTGETVAVSGEVDALVGENAFTLGGGEDGLLVVSSNLPGAVTDDTVLQAVGPVRMFTVADFEDELGIQLDDELFAEFENQPAVAAEEINTNVLPEAGPQNVTIADVVDGAGELDGQTVTVEGRVTEVLSPQAFVLEESLLVARGEGGADVEVGTTAQVSGAVMGEFDVAEAEQDLGVTFDDEDLFTEWVGQPAILAGDVQPSP